MTFDLDNMPIQFVNNNIFKYEGKKYHYKERTNYDIFNELIAHKIAERLNIPSAPCYYTTYNGETGVSSLMFDTANYTPMSDIMIDIYGTDDLRYNNLSDIWNALEKKYGLKNTPRLMDELVNIFLFDVVIGNGDRHNENLGIIADKDGIRFAPLFDHEYMLFGDSINYGFYQLGVHDDDITNKLYVFLLESDSSYLERLKSMMNKINDDVLAQIIKEIKDEGVNIPDDYINELFEKFNDNRQMIEMTIENLKFTKASNNKK